MGDPCGSCVYDPDRCGECPRLVAWEERPRLRGWATVPHVSLHILSTEHIFRQSDWLEMLEAMRAIEYAVHEFKPDRKEANHA